MGWMKDILNGVGDVADAVTPDFITDPILDIGRPFVEDGFTIGDPLRATGQLLDAPRKIVSGAIGEANYWTSGARNALGITSDEDLEEIRKAHAEGGGRGVWEDATVNDLPWFERALIDIGIDPLTYAGGFVRHLGKAGKLMEAAGEGNTLRRSVIGGGEKVARVLNAPDQLIDRGLAKAGGKFMDSRGGDAVRKIGNTGFVRTARKKFSEQLEYTDYVKAKLKADQAGDLITQMLLGRRNVDKMFGFVDAQSAVPLRLDAGLRESLDRNMINPDPSIYRSQDRRIRQQSMFPLTDNLEDRSIQMWSERNPDMRSRLLSTETGKSQLDTRVPRSNNLKDDIDPVIEATPEEAVPEEVVPGEAPTEAPTEVVPETGPVEPTVDYSSMSMEEKIKIAQDNLSFSERHDPLSEFNKALHAAERFKNAGSDYVDDSWIDRFLPNNAALIPAPEPENPLAWSEQFDLINPANRNVPTPESTAVLDPEVPVEPEIPRGPSGARILDESVAPLPRRAIKEELGRNTQDELRALRNRRSAPSEESMQRSRTLTDLEDKEWSDMATKVEADIDAFVTTSESTAFDLDPDVGFAEIAEPRGFRVPLAKVGTFSPGEGARVREVIENYRNVLQQPDIYMAVERNADGTYGLNISIDALTRDEAQLIGAATNASHYVDPTNTQSGGRTRVYHGLNNNESRYVKPAEVEDLVQAIEDARIGEGSLIDNLRDGDQIPEAAFAPDPVGPQMEAAPTGLYDPDTARPFEDRNFRGNFEDRGAYTQRSIREFNDRARGVGVRQAGSDYIQGMRRRPSDLEIRGGDGYFLTEKIDPLEPQKKSWSPFLAQDENEALFDVHMSDGVSIGDYANHAFDRVEADKALFAKAGVTWGPEETTHASREVYKRFSKSIETNLTPAEQKLIKQRLRNWDKLGLNPQADSVDSARHITQNKIMDDAGVTPPHQGKMARMRSIWSAVTLTSPRYIVGNLTTNIMDSMIAGHFRFDAYADFWKIVRSEMSRNEITDFLPGSKMEEYFGDVWGFTSDYAIHNRTQRNLTGSSIKGDSEIRKLARALHIEKTGIATVVESVQAMAQGLDTVARASMAMDVMDNVRYREMPGLLSKLDAIIEKSGVDLQGRQVLPKMDPAYIYSYYRGLGVPDGLAQRASRDVAEVRSMARKEATAEVERVALSYRRTKLDEKVATVIPFHYWASRKFRWYAEEAYRNPVLMANYARAIQGLERADDDPGLNARQKGFLRLFGGPAGFTMLMNPDAMMGVIRASQLNNTYQADGETELGGVLNFLQRYGIGLYPWLDGAANMIGAQGDTFEPDMIGIRHRGIIGAIVNYARGEGWLGEDNRDLGATPYADINMEAREKISTWVASFTPDWLSQPVPARDKSIVEASIESTIESRIIAENPGITNQELIALMNDPESDAYQSAFQDAARAGVIGQLISFSAPLTVKVKENTKDVRGAAYGEVKKAAAEAGIPVSQFDASDADAEFRAAYKSKTGKEFKLDDFNKMNLERDLINAANPQARNFLMYDMEYRSIGEGKAKQLSEEYYNLRNGSDQRTMHLPQDERDAYAKAWAERSGAMPLLKDMWDLQAAYKQSHPMFAQWKEWQSQMYQLQKMSGDTLAEYRRMVTAQNPSAAAYFRSQQMRLEDAGIAPEDMSRELDRITVSPNAWFAINGMPRTHSDPSMSVGAGDPMFGQVSPYANTSYDQPVVAPTGQNGAQWTQALANRGLRP